MKPINIGMIGLDTSHCIEFAKLLNTPNHPYNVKGGRIVAGYPFYSADVEISKKRVNDFTETLRNDFNVMITESIEEVASRSDAFLMTAVDGRKHMELFKELLPYKKPVFIDKPLVLSVKEAKALFKMAHEYGVPVMSSSSLRFAESYQRIVKEHKESFTSIYVHGPLPMQEPMPGYFWYGIHMIEMVIAALGTGVKDVTVKSNRESEVVIAHWEDGRYALIRGEFNWHTRFGATLHTPNSFYYIDISKDTKPFYASLLEEILLFFQTRNSSVRQEETLEVIRVIEMINHKR
ncbi:Gfo/Idh/MocA family protein [Rossellomorea sp. KS-H15a]|uniref:Gfo/Idh/MocA family protein n=1 Tax=Rossellomorea sp. KS-H15a TaxID=2963940 RepID=UPI0020C5E215|nr:Gfo/Idh/MocA family oxidoreductase [Rossellomorea sp. KS-H15a]UTE77437.1 Gfo/Idh/MocA family oxidoreductase [Rossellomorea sp. KS-H15a]